jgi:hypothetical protein
MFKWYAELSKAVDIYNEKVKEEIEYHEVLEMIQDRYNEKEVMELIIKFYSMVH